MSGAFFGTQFFIIQAVTAGTFRYGNNQVLFIFRYLCPKQVRGVFRVFVNEFILALRFAYFVVIQLAVAVFAGEAFAIGGGIETAVEKTVFVPSRPRKFDVLRVYRPIFCRTAARSRKIRSSPNPPLTPRTPHIYGRATPKTATTNWYRHPKRCWGPTTWPACHPNLVVYKAHSGFGCPCFCNTGNSRLP